MWRDDDREIIITTSFGPKYDSPITPRRKFSFSKREKKDLLIAIGILTLAFAIALTVNGYQDFVINLIASFGAIVTGFLLHELGHKFMAQKFGFWAEFNYSFNGLIFALILSFLGVIIASPGAVYISGYPTKKENGIISAAGPSINLVIAVIMLPLILITSGTISYIILIITTINLILAVFNLIPLGPLDGKKILRWSIAHYILIWTILIFVALLTYLTYK